MATLPIVNTIDKRRGIIAAFTVLILLVIYLMLTTFQQADPPPKDIPVALAEPMDITEIKNVSISGGGGGGNPSNDPINNQPEQTQQQLTQANNPKSTANSGQANSTNSANSQNNPNNTQQSNNPFANGGQGGNQGGGSGGTFGTSTGPGTQGTGGTGSGKGRVRLNEVNIQDLPYNSDELFHLQLVIDAEGNVIQIINILGKTTTTDQILINQVKAAVKKQVKYNKDPGAPLAKVYYTVGINAQ